ncbi:MAG: methylated-DNA--[protein]-cysteine S-methyltransferase [Phaeodactylibacter sp.]|nr:methylated-DNA--[protein]-cysteine S-methyltransferase [Phaeodactylibacter sp.]
MYQALVRKDSQFEGIFFAAIKTTGIFCRPTCSARKPKAENVEYFSSVKEAMDNGYRPCKVCQPLKMEGQAPEWLEGLLQEVRKDPEARLRDSDLEAKGINASRVRRWFKKHHGMTFQAYQRMLRLNQAYGQIKYGERVTEAAFQSGYDSLSGFGEAFKNNTGFAPSESQGKTLISITRMETPLGPMLAGATAEGICLLEFTDRRMLETQLERLRKYLKAEILPGNSPHFAALHSQLQAYFSGNLKTFKVPILHPGTDFQQQVWGALQAIPYGETRSYRQQAEAIGNPAAVRAVARANGDNRIAIIIPCHRVVGADGSLTGYGGGLWRKQRLLELEQSGG